ncbi:MAG TPA: aspartyl/asparaginyl beta-hydroxylase domain-containing protein, partial [Pseudomonadales bacterium]
GRTADADAWYRRALDTDSTPAQLEAIHHFARNAFATRDIGEAVRLCRLATEFAADDSAEWVNLGAALRASGDEALAQRALRRALELEPANRLAALCLAESWEKTGDADGALLAYFQAVTLAQRQGAWRSRETTPAALYPRVQHAVRCIDAGRRALYESALAPLVARFGRSELRRVEHCLSVYLGEVAARYADPRQKPTFLYFPDLPAVAYPPLELFPWIDALEQATDTIRREVLGVIAAGHGLEPFDDPAQLGKLVSGAPGDASWDAIFLFRHGRRFDANCASCPATLAAIEDVPLVRIADHGPEILFSLLRPGAHILPHRGVTNTRVVAHLALIVPRDCAFHVLGEPLREWREGRAFVFDDSFGHEAWNKSDQTRVILMVDTWNPYLTEPERAAVETLVAAIGDFRARCEAIAQR